MYVCMYGCVFREGTLGWVDLGGYVVTPTRTLVVWGFCYDDFVRDSVFSGMQDHGQWVKCGTQ